MSDDSSVDPSPSRPSPARDGGDEEEAAVRSALHFAVGRICLAEEEDAGPECARMSSEAIGALTELAYQYSTAALANDLVCFSRHANRRTVTADDVKLVARKDPGGLLSSLEKFCEKNDLGTSTEVGKGEQKSKGKAKKSGTNGSRSIVDAFAKSKPGTKRKSNRDKAREKLMKLIDESSSSSFDESRSVAESDNSVDDMAFAAGSRVQKVGGRRRPDVENECGLEDTEDEVQSNVGNSKVIFARKKTGKERRIGFDSSSTSNDLSSTDESIDGPAVRKQKAGSKSCKGAKMAIDLTEVD